MSRRNTRLLQVLGLLVGLLGLTGYWTTKDVPKAEWSAEQKQLVGLSPDEAELTRASFVVAGRDIFYEGGKSRPIYGAGGRIVGWDYYGVEGVEGTNTDTILYVSILGDELTMINIPRDIYLPEWRTKINAMHYFRGAEGLRAVVEDIVGLPVDYYAVINIDIFKQLVDALGGVEVNIPSPMRYRDTAAGLDIDFDAGPTHLSGEDAAKFIRYRNLMRGDIDRIDNIKRLAYALLARLRELNLAAAIKMPELVEIVFSNVETNASPALVRSLVPHLSQLTITAATLPTCCERRDPEFGDVLGVDAAQVESFLAATFGGEARAFSEAPEVSLLITNRSGEPGLEERYRARLVAMGVPEARILVREASSDPSATRLLTTARHWQDADYYAALLGTSKQQIDRFERASGPEVGAYDLELVLGADAAESPLADDPASHQPANRQARAQAEPWALEEPPGSETR